MTKAYGARCNAMQHQEPTQMLSYAAPAEGRYRYVNTVAVAASLLLLGVFYLGFVPSGAMAFDYTREIPITEVIAGVLRRSPREVLGNEFSHLVLFLSLGAIMLAAFVFVRHTWLKIVVSVFSVLLPLLIFPSIVAFVGNSRAPMQVLLILPLVIFPALIGQCDGETWSEGIVGKAVLLDWMILWLLLAVIMIWRRAKAPSA